MGKSILVIPDVHCKPKLVEIAREFVDKVDQIVFLGDYVDDWELPCSLKTGQKLCDIPICTDEQMVTVLDRLIAFKVQYSDKVVLLWGNHDWDYLHSCQYGSHSGYRQLLGGTIHSKFVQHEQLFQLAYWAELGNQSYLFSHAGLALSFQQRFADIFENYQGENLATTLNTINYSYDRRIFAYLGTDDRWVKTTDDVYVCAQGPLWERKGLIGDADPRFNQVVGHTPVKTVEFVENYLGNRLYFCDTFSTDGAGNKIGDEKLLLLTENEAYIGHQKWLAAKLV